MNMQNQGSEIAALLVQSVLADLGFGLYYKFLATLQAEVDVQTAVVDLNHNVYQH